jgi:hypothetical protein
MVKPLLAVSFQLSARAYLKIPNLTPKSPLHNMGRGLKAPFFSPLSTQWRGGRGVRLKGNLEFSDTL